MTPLGSNASQPKASLLKTVALTALVTGAAYLALLGWDQTRDVQPDGRQTGPYQAWQVVMLALVIALTAAAAGLRHRPAVATTVATIALTTCWTIDAATDPPTGNDGLWPVGAVIVAVGTFAGVALVSSVVAHVAGGGRKRL